MISLCILIWLDGTWMREDEYCDISHAWKGKHLMRTTISRNMSDKDITAFVSSIVGDYID